MKKLLRLTFVLLAMAGIASAEATPARPAALVGNASATVLACGDRSAAQAPTAAGGRPFRAQLIEPANEIAVAAGSTAAIVWDATGTPKNVEEWEAFVSIDGGKTYPVRITPHLDIAIRSFTWSVPAFPGAEGSILLRFGDEHEERRFAFARRFRVTGALSISALTSARARAAGRGEAAEPEGEGVLAWAEGPRDGSTIRQVAVDDYVLISGRQLSEPRQRASGQLAGSGPGRFDQARRRPSASGVVLLAADGGSLVASRFVPPSNILLTTRRRNI